MNFRNIGLVGLSLGVFFLCAFTVRADDAASVWAKRRAQYPELTSIYDLAEGAPPPLKALALLRIATAPGMDDAQWKKELLAEAFPAADQDPALWPTTRVISPTGRTSALANRLGKYNDDSGGLIRLTLDSEIVESMLGLSRADAILTFNQIAPLRLPVLTCSDGLTPDAGAYYQAAAAISKSGFTHEQKKNGDLVQFLRTLMGAITSPVEIKPAATMLAVQELPPDDTASVVSDFASRLDNLSGDNRAFFADLPGTNSAVMNLADSLSGSLASTVLKAWRNYLISNLTGERCRETVDSNGRYFKSAVDVVNAFNARVAGRESVAPIDNDAVRPGKIADGSASDSSSQFTDAERELQTRWFTIEFGGQPDGDALSNEQKSNAEWISNFDKFLDDISDLKPGSNESDTVAWQHKCSLMRLAIMAAPPGAQTDRVIAQYLQLVQLNDITLDQISTWYREVASFLRSADTLNHARGTVLRALLASDAPELVLVAKLERLQETSQPARR
jgi:hypothetical protein